MIYLGLDISSNRTGYFIYDEPVKKILDYGCVENEKTGKHEDNVYKLFLHIDSLCKKFHIDGCGIEKEFVGQNRKTALVLGHMHGAAISALKMNNIPFTYYAVMTLKTYTVPNLHLIDKNGKRKDGKQLKQEVQDYIINYFGKEQFYKEYKTDETDAASAAFVYAKFGGMDVDEFKTKTLKI